MLCELTVQSKQVSSRTYKSACNWKLFFQRLIKLESCFKQDTFDLQSNIEFLMIESIEQVGENTLAQ